MWSALVTCDGGRAGSRDGRRAGLLRHGAGQPLAIDGLWALRQGAAATGGADALLFSAGPEHGLIGKILPAA